MMETEKKKKRGFSLTEALSQRQQIAANRKDVDQFNHQALLVTSLAGFAISGVLLALSLFGLLTLTLPYALLTLFFGAEYLLSKTVLRTRKGLALGFYYLLMWLVMLLAIYMGTAADQSTNAVTFLLFLLLLPMFVLDRPWRLIASNAVLLAVFCLADVHYKVDPIRSLDLSNTVVAFCLSAVFIVMTVRRNLNIFKFRREEENRLSEKDRLINAIPVGVAIYEVRDGKTRQIFTNEEFYRLFEDTPEARTARNGGNFINSIHPEDRAGLQRAMKTVIDGADHMVEACRSVKGDGSYIWVRFAASVARREPGYLEVYCTYSSMEEEIRNRQASEAKTVFLSRMSHDIRTPMNAIIGMTKLGRQESNPARVQEYLEYIDHSSEFLLGLINDILDLSKIESGEFTLNPEPYPVGEFQADIESIITPLMEQKGIRFTYDMDCGVPCIRVDRLRFNQIFFNLLSNASKYTPTGGEVSFTARAIPPQNGRKGLRFCVKDNGAGMSREYQGRMFMPFTQDSYQSRGQVGTGLGLPIVKSLVDAMGGRILVDSEPGRGTEVTVDLFVEEAAAGAADAAPDGNASLEGVRVLLAEDNNLNVLVARRLLERRGCVVTVVNDGEACVAAFAAAAPHTFDAILMDVRMPKLDGIQATRQIRALPRPDAKQVPIIAMTADAFTEEKKKTLDAGMNAHLTKPVEPEKLYATLLAQAARG